MKIAVVSGGFDPIHSGHIAYLKSAAKYADKLIVCLNSDEWLMKKKGQYFLPFTERKLILENLAVVCEVMGFKDDAFGSAIEGLKAIKSLYPKDKIYFCNGGDRNQDNIPEMSVEGVEFIFSVGGDEKRNSSSWILKDWQYPQVSRNWGKFYNLFEDSFVKVKELIVKQNNRMSYQRHFKRNEIWLVSKGRCEVKFSELDPDKNETHYLFQGDQFYVPAHSWHQIINPFSEECRIIEIQYGEETSEDDIERLSNFNKGNL